MRQIRMLRAMWRELEKGLRRLLNGHAGGNPDTAKELPTGYRASSRPYRPASVRETRHANSRERSCRSPKAIVHIRSRASASSSTTSSRTPSSISRFNAGCSAQMLFL